MKRLAGKVAIATGASLSAHVDAKVLSHPSPRQCDVSLDPGSESEGFRLVFLSQVGNQRVIPHVGLSQRPQAFQAALAGVCERALRGRHADHPA